jgi:hypothetical protein
VAELAYGEQAFLITLPLPPGLLSHTEKPASERGENGEWGEKVSMV